MFFGKGLKVYLCKEVVDMRKSFDGLARLAEEVMGGNPLSGNLFVFFARGKNRVKILQWDSDGYWLHYKRLEEGNFKMGDKWEIDLTELSLILSGIELAGIKKAKRFSLSREKIF